MTETTSDVLSVSNVVDTIINEVKKAIVGKDFVLKQILAAILSEGNVLLEDYPGLAKTLIAYSIATSLGLTFHRIQFTPDLLPGDITGGYMFDREHNRFVLRKGPVFANLILADEINRASPRTQSALLEAMQERQVTIEGETMKLPDPFVVIATQNPIEYEGTFPLPEAQVDRFIIKLSIGYPSIDEEQEILRRRRERMTDQIPVFPVISPDHLAVIRNEIEHVHVDPDLERYIVNITHATRNHSQVAVGAGPRGSLSLLKLARTWAAMQGRTFMLPDDIKLFIKPALTHRLMLKPDLWSVPHADERIIDDIIRNVAVPVVQ